MIKKIISTSETRGLVLIILLLFLNYGFIWTRGGYADDFAFLAYSEGKNIYTAFIQWSFNSRYTQAVLLPLLIKVFSGAAPGEFYWWAFHAFSLICITVSLLFLNKILKLLNAPWVMRFTTVLFFALYPIKNTTIMWPATIVGYVFAVMLLLIGTYIYFSRAKYNTETVYSLFSVFFLFLLATFTIEQIIPIVLLIIILRLYLWKAKLNTNFIHIAGAIFVTTLFLTLTFSGSTAKKTTDFSLEGSQIIAHAAKVSFDSLYKFVVTPLKYLLDPYYQNDLLIAGSQPTFIAILLLLVVIAWYFTKIDKINIVSKNYRIVYFVLAGIILWLAAMSPLMVVSYGIPDRVLYLPLIGLSISSGAIVYLLDRKLRFFRHFTAVIFLICGAAFSLINLYAQNDYKKKWLKEETLINSLLLAKQDIQDGMTVNLFNFPSDYGPSPNLYDRFTFNGMVNWLFPNKNLSGETLNNFADVFQLPAQNSNKLSITFYPKPNHLVFLWADKLNKPIHLKGIRLNNSDNQNKTFISTNETGIIDSSLRSISKNIKGKKYSINIPFLISLRNYDLGLLKLTFSNVNQRKHNFRLHLQATHKNGTVIPYDRQVFLPANTTHDQKQSPISTMIFIKEISNISSITFFPNDIKHKKTITVH